MIAGELPGFLFVDHQDVDACQELLQRIERGVDPEEGPFETWAREEVALAPEDDMLFRSPEI